MFVVCVTVWVKPEKAAKFIAASLENAAQTRREAGNARLDVLRGVDDPSRFFLYEVYRSEDDFRAHQQTPHYLKWREMAADWMAQPRQGIKYHSVSPEDESA